MWGHHPKYHEDKIKSCDPQNDFEVSVKQFMTDSVKNFRRMAHALPDIGAAACAMDSVGQSLVHEIASLRHTISKRDDRITVITLATSIVIGLG